MPPGLDLVLWRCSFSARGCMGSSVRWSSSAPSRPPIALRHQLHILLSLFWFCLVASLSVWLRASWLTWFLSTSSPKCPRLTKVALIGLVSVEQQFGAPLQDWNHDFSTEAASPGLDFCSAATLLDLYQYELVWEMILVILAIDYKKRHSTQG